jgi:hypothetical protein
MLMLRRNQSAFSERFLLRKSKTAVDLSNPKEKQGWKSTTSRIFSPSVLALKALSSRIKLTRKERVPGEDKPGASTSNIRTTSITGMFSIRNTTRLPPEAIRTELLRGFSRVGNIVAIEEEGGFFCKFYAAPNQGSQGEDFSFFASMMAVLGIQEPTGKRQSSEPWNEKRLPSLPAEHFLTLPHLSSDAKRKVQFEVMIKRIPFSDLHGIQFNKISGDAWKVINSMFND